MSLPLKSHIIGRVVALFVGFFAGGVAFATLMFGKPGISGADLFLMPVLVFGGAYLAQLVFGYVVHADCPSCGADSAVPVGTRITHLLQ